jgi:adenosylcobinamide kinase/adenosylcobinamide-phosphate guanylyltransferase
MGAERSVEDETGRVLDVLARVTGPVVLVTGEVGLGIVPANAMSRGFADALGVVNQRVAAVVDRVVLVAAGLPLILKAEQPNSEVSI